MLIYQYTSILVLGNSTKVVAKLVRTLITSITQSIVQVTTLFQFRPGLTLTWSHWHPVQVTVIFPNHDKHLGPSGGEKVLSEMTRRPAGAP